MKEIIVALALITFTVNGSQAQAPTATEAGHYAHARAIAAHAGPAIWPGFRIDTIPLQVVIPNRGAMLLGWRDKRPEGYAPIRGTTALWSNESDRGAASTATVLNLRSVAQIVAND